MNDHYFVTAGGHCYHEDENPELYVLEEDDSTWIVAVYSVDADLLGGEDDITGKIEDFHNDLIPRPVWLDYPT